VGRGEKYFDFLGLITPKIIFALTDILRSQDASWRRSTINQLDLDEVPAKTQLHVLKGKS
jgi:hypothetical protein